MISLNKTTSCLWQLVSLSKYLFNSKVTLVGAIAIASWAPTQNSSVGAQTILSCNINTANPNQINTAIASLNQASQSSISNRVSTGMASNSAIQIDNLGITEPTGNPVNILSVIASGLLTEYQAHGLSSEEAQQATLDNLSIWAELSSEADSAQVIATIKQSLRDKLAPERAALITGLSDARMLATLAGLNSSSLRTLGLTPAEINQITPAEITPQTSNSFIKQIQDILTISTTKLSRPKAKEQLNYHGETLVRELEKIRQNDPTPIEPDSILNFRFQVNNVGNAATNINIPDIQTITAKGLIGKGKVTGVAYGFPGNPEQTITNQAQEVLIPQGQALNLAIQVEVGAIAENEITILGIDLQTNCGSQNTPQLVNLLPSISSNQNPGLIDPRGRVSGCAGETLANYLGFSVALYDIDEADPTASSPQSLTSLTTTELPNNPNNDLPEGIEPNIQNSNPFFLTNEDKGQYSFLFDDARGQLDQGRAYLLVVEPGNSSTYDQRQIKLTIGTRQERIVEYTATSLDGRPISAESEATTITGQIVLVEDAERIGLNLAVLDLDTDICDASTISLTKTADRASAQPGDIVLYRLTVQNLASTNLTNLQITDALPPGFTLKPESVQGEANGRPVNISISPQDQRVVNFTADTALEEGQSLTLIYGVEIAANALRGTADNLAIINAQRTDNNQQVKDGPAVYGLQLQSGVIRDSGTLIGRVFVDHNFDGEQQSGEPGVPNAVIYLENGNRIITDADGLFSVSNVLPGYHTGTLDLTSIPEYNLAPNLRFIERNSTSRLVNLEPGGLVRMNFGVTPTPSNSKDRSQARQQKPRSPSFTPANP